MFGMDFLTSHTCRWNLSTSLLYVDGHPLCLHAGPPGLKCRRVIIAEDIIIPPRSQVQVAAISPLHRLTGPVSEVMLDTHQLSTGLRVARTVLSGHATRFPLCVLNTSNEPQSLNTGECLGTLEALAHPAHAIVGPSEELTSPSRPMEKKPTVPQTYSPVSSEEQ